MDISLLAYIDQFVQGKNGRKQTNGRDLFAFEENGIKRTIEVTGSGKFVTIYSFDESKIKVLDEERFYQAINSVNEQMNTLSVEYFPEDESLKIKSSLLMIEGISIQSSIDYFFVMHDKYFKYIMEALANVNCSTDIENFGKLVKDSAQKKS